jgi:hypothetical protein
MPLTAIVASRRSAILPEAQDEISNLLTRQCVLDRSSASL